LRLTITNSRARPGSRSPIANGGSRILTRAIAEILEATPHESSFLSVFFQKEALIMKKMHCSDFWPGQPMGVNPQKLASHRRNILLHSTACHPAGCKF
jgi:hypothetical protein